MGVPSPVKPGKGSTPFAPAAVEGIPPVMRELGPVLFSHGPPRRRPLQCKVGPLAGGRGKPLPYGEISGLFKREGQAPPLRGAAFYGAGHS